MENTELLSKLNIPEEQYDLYFVKDQIVYPPLIVDGQVIKTGEERYNDKFNKEETEEVELTLWQKIKKGVGLKW